MPDRGAKLCGAGRHKLTAAAPHDPERCPEGSKVYAHARFSCSLRAFIETPHRHAKHSSKGMRRKVGTMGRHVAPTFFGAVIVWWSACVVALKQPPKHRGASRVRVHKLDQLHYEPERERKEHGRDEATSRRLHVDVETE